MAIRFGIIFIDNIDNFFIGNDRRKTEQQYELPQFLANFKFSKSTYGIDKAEFSLSSLSLENMTLIDNLSTLKRNIKNTFDRYSWHGYSKIPQEKRITQIKKQVSEECKVNPFFHSWRVSSEQNRKVNKIAEDLKSGKIVGEKIIDNVFDINASYCFITPEDLKNLKERLFIQQDIDITHVINQKKGEAFDHILINDIKYNLLDNTFHFIFNVDNSSQLTIKVPRKDLENYELPNTKKDIFNKLINIRRIDENLILKNNKEITNDLNPLLEQLKTQEFPLSDAITKAINQKEKGIALDYALINDIKYNLLDNTFHFIFNVDNSSQLTIKVPRKDLENYELPNTKKDIFNKLINIRRIDENLILKNNKEITNDLNPLLEQLKTQEFPLSDAITKAINQKEKGIALDYALINDIKYNLLDNTFHFIFDVGNPLLKESSQLIIEVPREALDLENTDRLVEKNHSHGSLARHVREGSFILDTHLKE